MAAPLRFHLVVPDSVRLDDAVPISLPVANPAAKPSTVYLAGRPAAFDILITRKDGTPVWQRLNSAVINAILQVRVLAPGESLTFSDTWKQQDNRGRSITPGKYCVTGILPGDSPEELRT